MQIPNCQSHPVLKRVNTSRETKTYAIPHALPISASVKSVCKNPQNPTSAANSRSKSSGVVRSALWYAAVTRTLVQRAAEIEGEKYRGIGCSRFVFRG